MGYSERLQLQGGESPWIEARLPHQPSHTEDSDIDRSEDHVVDLNSTDDRTATSISQLVTRVALSSLMEFPPSTATTCPVV